MARKPQHEPLLDPLGKLIVEGKDAATYLWQIPTDAATLQRIADLLSQIRDLSAGKGRREMPRICEELLAALEGPPGPQQADMLQAGFDRLYKLWKAAKSGIL